MEKLKKILIADDHPLLLRGLADFLKSLGYKNIIEANNGLEAYNAIIKDDPFLSILDIRMPKMSGLEIVRKCKTNRIKTKIILITLHQEKNLFDEAKRLGVSGYIFKQFALTEIEACLKQVLNNETYFSPELKKYFQIENTQGEILEILTPSEIKILRFIARNYTTPEIAETLYISNKTVEKHRSNIIKKLGLTGKTNSLLLWAKQNEKSLNLN